MISALARRLHSAGLDVRTGIQALHTQIIGGRVTAVDTTNGPIQTDVFVNAAGAGAHALAKRDSIDVAAVPLLESRVLADPFPEVAARPDVPMLLFFERDLFYVRTEDGALLLGAIARTLGPAEPVPFADPPRGADLPRHEAEGHDRLAHELAGVIPALRNARARERGSGLPTWTPDGRHILGPALGVEGYFVLSGCDESGVTHWPGLARLAAELIVDGAPRASISAYHVDRSGHSTIRR